MQKLVSANRQKKNINEQLVECWVTVVNPFSTTLHILENVYMFETGMLNVWVIFFCLFYAFVCFCLKELSDKLVANFL